MVTETPGILQFASPAITVNDTAGVAAISVVRTMGALGAVTVQYQTLDGIAATPGLNYEPTAGTLTLANGQTTGTILVPVLDDIYNNHDDYVAVVLNAPTGGAVLGTTTTTVLRIHDADPDFTPPQVDGTATGMARRPRSRASSCPSASRFRPRPRPIPPTTS